MQIQKPRDEAEAFLIAYMCHPTTSNAYALVACDIVRMLVTFDLLFDRTEVVPVEMSRRSVDVVADVQERVERLTIPATFGESRRLLQELISCRGILRSLGLSRNEVEDFLQNDLAEWETAHQSVD